MDWLMIHLANCYGVDKVSYAARLRWAADNHHMIRAVAQDPIGRTDWHNADGGKKAWQFLAACFAYEDFIENRFDSVCRVPVMLDGRARYPAYWTALLHDEESGRDVNLVPREVPSDLYREVANRTVELLVEGTLPFSREWAAYGGIDRDVVKSSVMVLPIRWDVSFHSGVCSQASEKNAEKDAMPTLAHRRDYQKDASRDLGEGGLKGSARSRVAVPLPV